MKNKGFTLLELLSVTVALIIIFLLSFVTLKAIIKNSKYGAFEDSVYSLIDAIDIYIADHKFLEIEKSGIDIKVLDDSVLKNNNFDDGLFTINDNKAKIIYIKQDNYCAKGTKEKLVVTDKGCGTLDSSKPTKADVFIKNISTNSIYLVAAGYDPDSEIIKYELSIDNGKYYTNSNDLDNVFKVDLNDYNVHKFKVRVTNEAGKTLESKVKEFKLKKDININIYETNNKESVKEEKQFNFTKDDNVKYSYSDSLENFKKFNGNLTIGSNKIIYFKIEKDNETYYNTLNITNIDSVLNGSYPKLDDNMIPVIYDGNNWIVANKYKKYWSYEDKIWANSVLVRKNKIADDSNSNSREYYLSSDAIGEKVYEKDILAFYVWIPKYKYRLFNISGKNKKTEIDIIFDKNTIKGEKADDNFITHNAFLYNNSNGFWVSKYESSVEENTDCYLTLNCNKDNLLIYSLNKKPITNISISNAYSISSSLNKINNIYGLSSKTTPHLITNLEWGAIVYLTNSKYGLDDISTTGNETGVMSMNETGEYVMANYNNHIGYNKENNSGFTKLPKKYIDIYKSISVKGYILGDATMETKNFKETKSEFVNSEYPFMIRGLDSMYSYNNSLGNPIENVSFRAVIST